MAKDKSGIKGYTQKRRNVGGTLPRMDVAEWAARFPYTPPPAIVKGPAPEETCWTPLSPTATRQAKRASRSLRGRKVHKGTHSASYSEAAAQVHKAVANVQ